MSEPELKRSPEPVEWKDARVIQVNESADAAGLARIAVIAAEAHARGYREGLERGAEIATEVCVHFENAMETSLNQQVTLRFGARADTAEEIAERIRAEANPVPTSDDG